MSTINSRTYVSANIIRINIRDTERLLTAHTNRKLVVIFHKLIEYKRSLRRKANVRRKRVDIYAVTRSGD